MANPFKRNNPGCNCCETAPPAVYTVCAHASGCYQIYGLTVLITTVPGGVPVGECVRDPDFTDPPYDTCCVEGIPPGTYDVTVSLGPRNYNKTKTVRITILPTDDPAVVIHVYFDFNDGATVITFTASMYTMCGSSGSVDFSVSGGIGGCSASVSGNGTFTCSFLAPPGVTPGWYTITSTFRGRTQTARRFFDPCAPAFGARFDWIGGVTVCAFGCHVSGVAGAHSLAGATVTLGGPSGITGTGTTGDNGCVCVVSDVGIITNGFGQPADTIWVTVSYPPYFKDQTVESPPYLVYMVEADDYHCACGCELPAKRVGTLTDQYGAVTLLYNATTGYWEGCAMRPYDAGRGGHTLAHYKGDICIPGPNGDDTQIAIRFVLWAGDCGLYVGFSITPSFWFGGGDWWDHANCAPCDVACQFANAIGGLPDTQTCPPGGLSCTYSLALPAPHPFGDIDPIHGVYDDPAVFTFST